MLYSYTVSSLSNFVQDSDKKAKRLEHNLEILDEISLKFKIDKNLNSRIVRFLKYEYKENKVDNNIILVDLPISLRNDIMSNMYKDLISSFVFFKNFSNLDFIYRVLLIMKPHKALRNDILVKEGEMIEETIFVKNGILSLEITINLNRKHDVIESKNMRTDVSDEKITTDFYSLKIIQIRQNEHFGDVLMFLNKPSFVKVRVKSKFSDLLLMKKLDFANISRDFPEIYSNILTKSIHNMDKIVSLVEESRTLLLQGRTKNDILSLLECPGKRSKSLVVNSPDKHLAQIKRINEKKHILLKSNSLNQSHHIKKDNQTSLIKSFYRDINLDDSLENSKLLDEIKVNNESICPSINEEDVKPSNVPYNSITFNTRYTIESLTNIVDALRKDTNYVYGFINKDFDKFIIADGFVIPTNSEDNGYVERDNMKFIKIQSIPWMNKEIETPISFSINDKVVHPVLISNPNEEQPSHIDNIFAPVIEKRTKKFWTKKASKEDHSQAEQPAKKQRHNVIDRIDNVLECFGKHSTQPKSVKVNNINQHERQMDMLSEIQKNILNSNLTVKDPEKFYRNWILEIYKKTNERIRDRKKKTIFRYKKMTTRLKNIKKMFDDKFD
jgi:CRP-like cAMP-binding protein